jgi:hypothetical protein
MVKISEEFQYALKELNAAIIFFDKVHNSSADEQIAVGRDHWNGLESSARRVVAFYISEADDTHD